MLRYRNLDEEGVRAVAAALAEETAGRDAVIGLIGDLGAGKTTFTQAYAKALGVKRIVSPTFIVIASHQLGSFDFFHIDFYRLRKPAELRPLGLDQIIQSTHRIALIEWVDRFPAIQKQCDILIRFKILKHNLRDLTISSR